MGLGISVALSIGQAALRAGAAGSGGPQAGVTPEQMRARRMYQRQARAGVWGGGGVVVPAAVAALLACAHQAAARALGAAPAPGAPHPLSPP